MPCKKCGGLMLGIDCRGDWLEMCRMWSCVNCGECLDAQILANRAGHSEPRNANHADHQPVRVGG